MRDALRGCPPLIRLTGGGVLIVLRYYDTVDGTIGTPLSNKTITPAIDTCASVGSKGESLFWKARGATTAENRALLVSVCRNAPAEPRTDRAVEWILESATSGDAS